MYLPLIAEKRKFRDNNIFEDDYIDIEKLMKPKFPDIREQVYRR